MSCKPLCIRLLTDLCCSWSPVAGCWKAACLCMDEVRCTGIVSSHLQAMRSDTNNAKSEQGPGSELPKDEQAVDCPSNLPLVRNSDFDQSQSSGATSAIGRESWFRWSAFEDFQALGWSQSRRKLRQKASRPRFDQRAYRGGPCAGGESRSAYRCNVIEMARVFPSRAHLSSMPRRVAES